MGCSTSPLPSQLWRRMDARAPLLRDGSTDGPSCWPIRSSSFKSESDESADVSTLQYSLRSREIQDWCPGLEVLSRHSSCGPSHAITAPCSHVALKSSDQLPLEVCSSRYGLSLHCSAGPRDRRTRSRYRVYISGYPLYHTHA